MWTYFDVRFQFVFCCCLDLEVFLKTVLTDIRDTLHTIRDKMMEEDDPSPSPPPQSPSPPPPPQSPPPPPPPPPGIHHPCGGIGWRTVAYYNMSNPWYTCPAGWHYHSPPTRGCSRTSHDGLTCDSAFFPVNDGQYTEVCGRIYGYQFGYTEAFRASYENTSITINEAYVTGVSITHRNPRQHIWTYAVGRAERRPSTTIRAYCPCDQTNSVFIPPYVGGCWYCESGDNSNYGVSDIRLFADDILWDGEDCSSTVGCCQFEDPRYFSVTVDSPTDDPIEARICNYYTSQYSNVIVSHFEIYVR